MNSAEELSMSDVLEGATSASEQLHCSDTNANVNSVDQSKGAIPKAVSKGVGPVSLHRKPLKLNNNYDEMLAHINNREEVQLPNSIYRLNGFANGLTRPAGSYISDYKSVFCDNVIKAQESDSPNVSKNNVSAPSHNCYNKTENVIASLENACSSGSFVQNLHIHDYDSKLNFVQPQFKLEDSDSSSDTANDDNELLSVSDDGCIYTYKGDHVADLPSSFFRLDFPLPESPKPTREETASPEMDYLEMDFDPGPSGDADSDSGSNADLENTSNLPIDSPNVENQRRMDEDMLLSKILNTSDILCHRNMSLLPSTSFKKNINHDEAKPCCSTCVVPPTLSQTKVIEKKLPETTVVMPWTCSITQRTSSGFLRPSKRHHSSTGELGSPNERLSFVITDSNAGYPCSKLNIAEQSIQIEKTMVWSEKEADIKQICQIGASACGATAVLNALSALNFPLPSIEKVQEVVPTHLRSLSSSLKEYLLSRSVAGSTHEDLITGLTKASGGQIYARFFHMYPERIVNLYSWLSFWIKSGAVPIATLNLQKCSGNVPDAWHHQMIFGVGPQGIYLANPLECVPAEQLWPQLCSESVLLIRKEDVLSRWNIKTDLVELMQIKNHRWRKINVVGQVANLVRESRREINLGFVHTTHIKIPAAYSSGITLALSVNSPTYSLLSQCSELPLLQPEDIATAL